MAGEALGDEYPIVPIAGDSERLRCLECSFLRVEDGASLTTNADGEGEVPCGLALFREVSKGPQTVPGLRAVLAAGGEDLDCSVAANVEANLADVGKLWTEVVLSPQQTAFLNAHLEGQQSPGHVIGQYDVPEGRAFVFAGLAPLVDQSATGAVKLCASNGTAVFAFLNQEVARVSAEASTGFNWVNPFFERPSEPIYGVWQDVEVMVPAEWRSLSLELPEGLTFSVSIKEDILVNMKSCIGTKPDGSIYIGYAEGADLDYLETLLDDLLDIGGRYKFEA